MSAPSIFADVLRVFDNRQNFINDRLKYGMFGYAIDTDEIMVRSESIPENDGYRGVGKYDDTELRNELNTITTRIANIIDHAKEVTMTASLQNPLVNKEYVDSSISNVAARFIVPTNDDYNGIWDSMNHLFAGEWYYRGSEIAGDSLSAGDYAVVKDTEVGSDGEAREVFWRVVYDGNSWYKTFKINNSSFTAEQWHSINSKATDDKITAIDRKLETVLGDDYIGVTSFPEDHKVGLSLNRFSLDSLSSNGSQTDPSITENTLKGHLTHLADVIKGRALKSHTHDNIVIPNATRESYGIVKYANRFAELTPNGSINTSAMIDADFLTALPHQYFDGVFCSPLGETYIANPEQSSGIFIGRDESMLNIRSGNGDLQQLVIRDTGTFQIRRYLRFANLWITSSFALSDHVHSAPTLSQVLSSFENPQTVVPINRGGTGVREGQTVPGTAGTGWTIQYQNNRVWGVVVSINVFLSRNTTIASNATVTNIYTLPTDARPLTQYDLRVLTSNSLSLICQINTNGTLTLINDSGQTIAANIRLSIQANYLRV